MARTGYNFRSTAAYVTDGSGESVINAEEAGSVSFVYPAGPDGSGYVSTTGLVYRNRSTGIDRRIAGAHYPNGTGTAEFKVDLPDGPGTYNVWVLMGDNSAGWNHQCVIKDGATTLTTLTGTTATARWLDTGGTATRTAANIAADTFDPLELTFSGGTAHFVLGNGVGTGSFLAQIAFEATGGGGSSSAPISLNYNRLRRA